LPMKKITIALKLFFPSDLVPILFVLFWKFTSNEKFFQFYPSLVIIFFKI
jgi:hypothetical protein